MRGSQRLIVLILTGLLVGLLGYLAGVVTSPLVREGFKPRGLPEDLKGLLGRFRFVNKATGQELRDYRVFGVVKGVYTPGGPVYETYVLGFEDRPGGAEADQDYLDLMVEIKRGAGGKVATVRIAQLGLDPVEVYLDGRLLGVVKPVIEVQVKLG